MPGTNTKSDSKSSTPASTPLVPTAVLYGEGSLSNSKIILQNGLFARAIIKNRGPKNKGSGEDYVQIYDATGKTLEEIFVGTTEEYVKMWAMPGNQIFYGNNEREGILKVIDRSAIGTAVASASTAAAPATTTDAATSETPALSKFTLTKVFERQLQDGRERIMPQIIDCQLYDETHMLVKFVDYPNLVLLTPDALRVGLENQDRINALFTNLTPNQQAQMEEAGSRSDTAIEILIANLPGNEKPYFSELLKKFFHAQQNPNAIKLVKSLLACIPATHQIVELDTNKLGAASSDVKFAISPPGHVVAVNGKQLGVWQNDGKQFDCKQSKTLAANPSSLCSLGEQKFALAYPIRSIDPIPNVEDDESIELDLEDETIKPGIEDETIQLEIWDFATGQAIAKHAIKNAGKRFLSMQALTLPPNTIIATAPSLSKNTIPSIFYNERVPDITEDHSRQHVIVIDTQTGEVLEIGNHLSSEVNLFITPDSKAVINVDRFGIALFDPQCSQDYRHEIANVLYSSMSNLDLVDLITQYLSFKSPKELIAAPLSNAAAGNTDAKRTAVAYATTASAGDQKRNPPIPASVTISAAAHPVAEIAPPVAGVASVGSNATQLVATNLKLI